MGRKERKQSAAKSGCVKHQPKIVFLPAHPSLMEPFHHSEETLAESQKVEGEYLEKIEADWARNANTFSLPPYSFRPPHPPKNLKNLTQLGGRRILGGAGFVSSAQSASIFSKYSPSTF